MTADGTAATPAASAPAAGVSDAPRRKRARQPVSRLVLDFVADSKFISNFLIEAQDEADEEEPRKEADGQSKRVKLASRIKDRVFSLDAVAHAHYLAAVEELTAVDECEMIASNRDVLQHCATETIFACLHGPLRDLRDDSEQLQHAMRNGDADIHHSNGSVSTASGTIYRADPRPALPEYVLFPDFTLKNHSDLPFLRSKQLVGGRLPVKVRFVGDKFAYILPPARNKQPAGYIFSLEHHSDGYEVSWIDYNHDIFAARIQPEFLRVIQISKEDKPLINLIRSYRASSNGHSIC